jgi:hypothetical protein
MDDFKIVEKWDGNKISDKETYGIKILFERDGYNGIGEKIPKQKNGPFKQYLNSLKNDNDNQRTNNWRLFGRIVSGTIVPANPFSREEAIYILLKNENPENIIIMFRGHWRILLKDMFNQNNRVYNEVLKYIWKIHHMKVTLLENSSTNKTKYTVEDSGRLINENTHFIIKDVLSYGRKYKRVDIDNDDGATVIDDEMGDNEQSGGKRRKTKSKRTKKSSPKRKRRTNRRR